jgi:hypothetical protein
VGVVGEVELEGLGGWSVLRGDGKSGLFFLQAIVGEGVKEGEEVGDFVFGETEVAQVIVIHGFGEVGDAPAFGFEVALVVEFEYFAESGDAAIVKVGGGEGDVSKRGCPEFAKVVGITRDGKKAGVFFATRRNAQVVVAEIGEEGMGPILRFKEVAVGAACGGAVGFEATFLRKSESIFVSGAVAVERGVEGAEEGIFQEFNEGAIGEVGELGIVLEGGCRELAEIGGFAESVGEFGFVFEVHFMSLKEGLADLGEEIFGPAIVKKAAFPGEDLGAVGEENVLVCEGGNQGRIHE